VRREIQILVLFYNFPYLLCTERKSRSRDNTTPITSKPSRRNRLEKSLPQLSNLYKTEGYSCKPIFSTLNARRTKIF
jgi:hypothetical protein